MIGILVWVKLALRVRASNISPSWQVFMQWGSLTSGLVDSCPLGVNRVERSHQTLSRLRMFYWSLNLSCFRPQISDFQGKVNDSNVYISPQNGKRTLMNSSYEVKFTLKPKPHKDPTEKVNHRLISIINRDTKILKKLKN